MFYRDLGSTGLKVSQLGFGAMHLPMKDNGSGEVVDRDLAIPMIHAAFDAGVNYIDTAVGYCNQDSQRAVGEALKGRRDNIILSTKNHYYGKDEGEWWGLLEQSLERLQVDHIDIYNHHGLNWNLYTEHVEPLMSKWMMKAKEQGLIRHICNSFHDGNDSLKKLVEAGYPDVITLQYNLLDRQLEEGIALAHEKGIGVVVMGPVAGGRLGATSEVLESLILGIKRVPELALRFVLSNPNVSMALSGMRTIEQVRENVASASDAQSLSESDRIEIDNHMTRLKSMAELYCTGCNYCMPCPQEVAIPTIFETYNMGRVYGLWHVAKKKYAVIGSQPWMKGKHADACTECGACEEKCPQKIPIRKQLAEAHEALYSPQ